MLESIRPYTCKRAAQSQQDFYFQRNNGTTTGHPNDPETTQVEIIGYAYEANWFSYPLTQDDNKHGQI